MIVTIPIPTTVTLRLKLQTNGRCTLPPARGITAVRVYLNGLRQCEGYDYAVDLTGATITPLFPWPDDAVIVADIDTTY